MALRGGSNTADRFGNCERRQKPIMEEPILRAAVVGDAHSPEMAPVPEHLARSLAGWEAREFPGLGELLRDGPAEGFFPDLVLVCQRWRDEYSAHEVREGLATFPVARWICVYGAWCESEGRHGSRWPMAVRVPLRSLETRLATEAAVVRGDIPALALTAARDEVFEFDTQHKYPTWQGPQRSVMIHSPDRRVGEWLSDLCRDAGLRVVASFEESETLDIVVWDLDPLTEEVQAEIRRQRQQHPEARWLGLMGLAPPEVVADLKSEGIDEVLPKLAPAAQILSQILAAAS